MTKIFFIISVMMFTAVCSSQTEYEFHEKKNDKSISANVGLNQFRLQDKYISPYIFSGFMFASEIKFESESETNKHEASIYFSTGGIDSDIHPTNVNPNIAKLSYSYNHKVNSIDIFNRQLNLSIGAGISLFGNYTTVNSTDNITNASSYDDTWYVSEAIDFRVSGKYLINTNNNLLVSFTMPLFKLISRPENGHYLSLKNTEIINNNKFKVLTGGSPKYFWSEFTLLCEIKYQTALNEFLNLDLKYLFAYATTDTPAELLSMGMYMNSLLVGINWKL